MMLTSLFALWRSSPTRARPPRSWGF